METKMAYIAGVVDGEGSLLVGKYKRPGCKKLAYRGYMGISNTHVPMLQEIKNTIGGKIVVINVKKEPYAGHQCFTLSLTTNSIREWLPKILPFLIVKKEQAEVLLAFLKRQADNASAPVSDELRDYYEDTYQTLKRMKKVRYKFKEEKISFGSFSCAQCGNKFERTSRQPQKIYCSVKCKKIVHYTRSNARIREGIPAWNSLN